MPISYTCFKSVKNLQLAGALELDLDSQAERYAILRRDTFSPLFVDDLARGHIFTRYIPKHLALDGVIVAITDKDDVYNIVAFDGVTCPVVNVNEL